MLVSDGLLALGGHGGLFRSDSQGAEWSLPITFWQRFQSPKTISPYDEKKLESGRGVGLAAIQADQLLLGSFGGDGVFFSTDNGRTWSATRGPRGEPIESKLASVASSGHTCYLIDDGGNLLLSQDQGRSWNETSISGVGDAVLGLNGVLFGTDAADHNIWRSTDGGRSSKSISEGLSGIVLGGAQDVLYAGTEAAGLFRLEPATSGGSWLHKASQGLPPTPKMTAIWVDQEDQNVILLGTDKDLWWSKDGGETFERSQLSGKFRPDRRVKSIVRNSPRSFFVSTDLGLYYVEDFIPRAGLQSRLGAILAYYDRHKQSPTFWIASSGASLLGTYLLAVFGLVVAGTLGGSIIFSRGFLISLASKPLLNTPGLIRWALFLGYRGRVLNRPSVKQAAESFYGLPASCAQGPILPDLDGQALISAVLSAVGPQSPVLIVGTGGAGKTTLLSRLAYLGLNDGLSQIGRSFRPVLVSPSYYDGSLTGAVAATLREVYGVGVDEKSTISQLQSGGILILFDGVSEILGDKEAALAEMIRTARHADYQDCRFVFSTRGIEPIPPNLVVFQLHGLRLETISMLLSESKIQVEYQSRVLHQLRAFARDSVEPLLLAMVLEADNDQEVGGTRTSLYERFIRRKLKISEMDQITWAGWRLAFEVIAEHSLLRSGNRGSGLSYESLMDVIDSKSDDQNSISLMERLDKYFRIKFDDPASLAKRAESDGILEGGRRWRFSHDTFEEFFAASRLASFFANEYKSDDSWKGRLLVKWADEEKVEEFETVFSFLSEMIDQKTQAALARLDMPETWLKMLNKE
jgi:hypothetical protein